LVLPKPALSFFSPTGTYFPFIPRSFPNFMCPVYSPLINPAWSFSSPALQQMPYSQSSLFMPYSQSLPLLNQLNSFPSQALTISNKPSYFPIYTPFSGPDLLNISSILSGFNSFRPKPPSFVARAAAVTSPPPSPPAPVGIESLQFQYRSPSIQSMGVGYIPGQGGYVTGQVLVTFQLGTPPIEMNRVYGKHQCREIYTSPYAGFKILALPSYLSVSEAVSRLSVEPSTLFVSPNYYRNAHFTPNDPYYNYQWHLPRLNCSYAWDLSTGTGALVGLLDSGMAYQTAGVYAKAPDLAGTAVIPGYDFINGDPYPDDDYGHGTHMAGCIAQTTNNYLGVAGVAFNATIMPIKVMDNTGNAPVSVEIEGIYYATNNGVNIISMSLGGDTYSATEQAAVTYAYENGVTLICSAGNSFDNIPEYPASLAECISVSAIRYDYTKPAYSNYGQYINVCAPGGDLSVDQNADGFGDGILQQTHNDSDYTVFNYSFMEGTSPACALVAGVAALIVSKSSIPLTPAQVTGILEGSATDLGAPGWDEYFGYGLVNAYLAAIQTP